MPSPVPTEVPEPWRSIGAAIARRVKAAEKAFVDRDQFIREAVASGVTRASVGRMLGMSDGAVRKVFDRREGREPSWRGGRRNA